MKIHMNRIKLHYLGLLLGFLLLTPQAWGQSVGKEIMLPMADGVKLHTIYILPKATGKYPTLLLRTPYSALKPGVKAIQNGKKALSAQGVVYMIQNARGRFKSEGTDRLFGDDKADGAYTVAWIKKQPWSNGVVATQGGSALGITQYMMSDQAQGLNGQYIRVAVPDMHKYAIFWGGVLRESLLFGWTGNQAKTNNKPLPHQGFLEIGKNPNPKAPFWAKRRVQDWSKVTAPGIHIGGWYDVFVQGTIDGFVGYSQKGASAQRSRNRLIIGPWAHGVGRAKVGDVTFPANSGKPGGFSLGIIDAAWLNATLKNKWGPLNNLAPVTFYLMGPQGKSTPGNRWVSAKSWPPPHSTVNLYLRANNVLSTDAPTTSEKPDTFTYDPQNPVPTLGGQNLVIPSGPKDQRPAEKRKDVIIFTTPPLKQVVNVAGRIRVVLWVSSSAKDTDFTAKLTDVYPDGRSMLLSDGIIRVQHRNGLDKTEPVAPGTPVKVTIDCWSTAIAFDKGHRIRLAISSSNFPRFQRNTNLGGKFSLFVNNADPRKSKLPQNVVKANNTIYHDTKHASYLLLPILGGKTPPKEQVSEPDAEPTPEPNSEPTPEPTPEKVADAGTPAPEKSQPEDKSSKESPQLPPDDTASKPDASAPTTDTHQHDQGSAGTSGCGCQSSPLDDSSKAVILLLVGLIFFVRKRYRIKV